MPQTALHTKTGTHDLEYARELHLAGVPLFTVGTNGGEDGTFPTGWPAYDVAGNGRRMQARRPDDALAALMGRGLLAVADADPRNAPDGVGVFHRLDQILSDCDAPVVAEVATGGGGRHFLVAIGSAPLASVTNLLPGIDLVADRKAAFLPGGYPRAKHNGRGYTVVWSDLGKPHKSSDDGFREWIAAARDAKAQAEGVPRRAQEAPLPLATPGGRPWTPQAARYCAAALNGELAKAQRAQVGQRNEIINVAAFQVGSRLAAYRTPAHVLDGALRSLLDVARDRGERDANVRSAFASGLARPYLSSKAP